MMTINSYGIGSSNTSEEAVQYPQHYYSKRNVPRSDSGSKQWRHSSG